MKKDVFRDKLAELLSNYTVQIVSCDNISQAAINVQQEVEDLIEEVGE